MSVAMQFIERSRYYLATEYMTKLSHCARVLPDDAVWRRANEKSNSIGNLLVHLTGNIRQWIVEGVGGTPVERDRPSEFSRSQGGNASELIGELARAVGECDRVLAALSPEDLERKCTIQGRETTVLSAVYHVVEHFAMHTGQIVMLTKQYVPGSIGFYDDSGWQATPTWGGTEGMWR
ncbi:MAG TPA: DinB family protein [Gemmatimonadaceae bacterium]